MTDSPEPTEIWQARFALRELGYPPDTPMVLGKPPEPDVVATLPDGRTIGIELTELTPQGPRQRRIEGEQDAISEAAHQLLLAGGPKGTSLSLVWEADFDPTKRDRQKHAEAVVAFVTGHMPRDGEKLSFDKSAGLPEGLSGLHIRLESRIEGRWQAVRTQWVSPIDREDVTEALSRKNGKPVNYTGGYNSIVLLLIVGGAGPATWGALSADLATEPFVTPFNSMVVFHRLQVRTQTLQVAGA